MIALRDYQETAITQLREKADKLLTYRGSKTLTLRAPTGSGKTVMVAEFLKRFVIEREDDLRFAFVWAAPRQLHIQSKQKLENYYFDSKALKCLLFEDIADHQLYDREILFLNWESINKEDNIIIRENERDFNLSTVLENTTDEDIIVVLIIDESHYSAQTEKSIDLITSTIINQCI